MKVKITFLFVTLTIISSLAFGAASTYYVTTTGAGDNSGDSWANAMAYSNFETDIEGSSEDGDLYYVMSGTYTLTSALSPLAGGQAAHTRIVGVSDEALTVASGTDRPLFACGAYEFTIPAYFNIENIRGTASNVNGLYLSGIASTGINCSWNQQATSGTRYGIYVGGTWAKAVSCSATSAAATGYGFAVTGTASSAVGCYSYDSYRGFNIGTYCHVCFSIVNNCDYGVIVGPASGIANVTIYDSAIRAVFLDYGTFAYNIIIHTSPIGISLDDAYDKYNISYDYINTYNCTMDVTQGEISEDNDLKSAHWYELDPQFVNAPGANFAIGTNLKSLGFPGTFNESNTTGYMDIGAVQREEPTASGGGETSVGYVN